MGIQALTTTNGGKALLPESAEDWADWVSASATRNYVIGDPLLDWLNLHGSEKGFVRDDELPTYDPRTDFTQFIFSQGSGFETAVIDLLRREHPQHDLVTVSQGHQDIRNLNAAEATFEAMLEGVPLIYQAVLRDAEHRTYGAPDLLVRSDVLLAMFPDCMTADAAAVAAPDLEGRWHYCVLDAKFSTLRLNAGGELGNTGSAKAYKPQVHIYNRALGRLQGYEPPVAFLLGRGWEQRVKRETLRGSSCLERLAPVPQLGTLARGFPISRAVSEATEWIRRVRREGVTWDVTAPPSTPELYPNMTNNQDGPWHAAKKQIAEELGELTLLWQVGQRGRDGGHADGVFNWHDPACTPAAVGVTGEKRAPTLQAVLDINRADSGPVVQPAHISAAGSEWHPEPTLEFYVDFETVNDLADDFSSLPLKGGQPLIFMIGCGHVENGEWQFASFTVDAMTEAEEARIIEAWLAEMARTKARLDASGPEPMVIHWSPAELTNFETAYNSAKARHGRDWPSPRWFDFLREVMWAEPVVVRGAMAFGLKAIAKALHSHGLVKTVWGDGPTDGLGAMVGAWWCSDESRRTGLALSELDLMQEVVAYNEVDCRVMMETVAYLRANH